MINETDFFECIDRIKRDLQEERKLNAYQAALLKSLNAELDTSRSQVNLDAVKEKARADEAVRRLQDVYKGL